MLRRCLHFCALVLAVAAFTSRMPGALADPARETDAAPAAETSSAALVRDAVPPGPEMPGVSLAAHFAMYERPFGAQARPVPEPGTIALFAIALLAIVVILRLGNARHRRSRRRHHRGLPRA